MIKTIVVSILLFMSASAYAETTAWIGPITVISNKFVTKGGLFGFAHSLDRADCC